MKNKKVMLGSILMLVLLTVGLCGCTDVLEANYNVLNDGITMTISGYDGNLRLYVGGDGNDITVTKDVNLSSVIVDGEYNIVRISRGHNVTVDIYKGVNSRLEYYD